MTSAPPTMQDVATLAGVSMKTVSNVINGALHVRPGTRLRVEQAIRQLGYRPNLSARSLARGRSGVIALVVPELDMPYFASLSRTLVEQAQAAGYLVLVEQTLGQASIEERVVEGDFPHRIDGAIFHPLNIGADQIASRTSSMPLVLIGERPTQRLVADHVVVDDLEAARCVVSHLIGLERYRIAFIGPDAGQRHARFDGYCSALADAGVQVDRRLVARVDANTGADGEHAMDSMLLSGQPPNAVFCATDWLALGAIRSLRVHGLNVPGDVAVAGFDDIPYGQTAFPSLTTIRTGREEIARLALESLERQVEASGSVEPVRWLVGFELVVRESTVPDPKWQASSQK